MTMPISNPEQLPAFTVLHYYQGQEVYPPFQDYAQVTLTNSFSEAAQVKDRWETIGVATIHRTDALPFTVRASEKFQQAYRHWRFMIEHGVA